MKAVDLETIRRTLDFAELIDAMRGALIAQSRGECDTPMPMHLAVPPERAEIHIKSSYRLGGKYFAMKVASTFPGNRERGRSTSSGMMLLLSAETGDPLAYFADNGEMTDLRTAAVAAMTTRELGRTDKTLGVIGAGIQGRLQARMHAEVLPVEEIVVHDAVPERATQYVSDMKTLLPKVKVTVCGLAAEVASRAKLIVTVTPSRTPHFGADAVRPGTHINAVGADTAGKNELDPGVLRRAALVLVDSRAQCRRLGELQHAPDVAERAVEIGAWIASPTPIDADAVTVADFTGLGVEDLFIAQYVYEHLES
ncbi:MAG TPA: ornithine cyclodeaminase family protein [Planctomycetota bacterium]|nr:ornithine cyclodeaminase family protein [Planctomycetota bacterium]